MSQIVVDIYRIINGKYCIDQLVTQIEIKDSFSQFEILEFCNENNVMISNYSEDVLICRDTKEPKYFIK